MTEAAHEVPVAAAATDDLARLSRPEPDVASPMHRPWLESLRVAVGPWILAHLLVFGVIVVERARHDRSLWYGAIPNHIWPSHYLASLYTWDGVWYLNIATNGYGPRHSEEVHFFPLLPISVKALAAVTPLTLPVAMLVVCWSAALLFGAALHRLVVVETGDVRAAVRAAWLSQLAPGAFVLVMGYTEGLAGLLAVLYFLAVRRDRPVLGFVTGLACGVVRPTGVLLALAGAVEAARGLRSRRDGPLLVLRRLLVAAAPALGLAGFLLYSKVHQGSFAAPYTVQLSGGQRGGTVVDPLRTAFDILTRGGGNAAMLSIELLVAGLALLWVACRRLPPSYAAWAVPSFVLAVTARGFASLPRYVSGVFPLLIAAALLTTTWKRWAWTLGVSSVLMAYFAYLAFTSAGVP